MPDVEVTMSGLASNASFWSRKRHACALSEASVSVAITQARAWMLVGLIGMFSLKRSEAQNDSGIPVAHARFFKLFRFLN